MVAGVSNVTIHIEFCMWTLTLLTPATIVNVIETVVHPCYIVKKCHRFILVD
jgi:hypothetical protein